MLGACDTSPGDEQGPGPVREAQPAPQLQNPLEQGYVTEFDVPPFHQVRPEHLAPALESAVDRAALAIQELARQEATPSVENTLVALARAEADVLRIARLWLGLNALDDAPELRAQAPELTALLARHRRNLLDNPALFARVDQLYQSLPNETLSSADTRLIDESWRSFRRAGAHLDEAGRHHLAELEEELDAVDARWAELRHVTLQEPELLIEEESRLSSLPSSMTNLARRSAQNRGHDHGWAFTLHAHSFYPFMRHFPEREARRSLYLARERRYNGRGSTQPQPEELIARLAELRAQRAALLGFSSHLDFLLDDASMDRAQLDQMLNELTQAAQPAARSELQALQALAEKDGLSEELQPWDNWYYRQRLQEANLNGIPGELEEWFMPEQVTEGLFTLADRLWDLRFRARPELPTWHGEVSAWEVEELSGESLGILYLDLLHRPGKRGGAWTSHFVLQHYKDEQRIRPVVAIVTNLPPPAAGRPAGLDIEQVQTLFHEFGHAMHALLSDVEHAALAGTNVPPDFVEFPALLMERWALTPQLLGWYARRHESGQTLDAQTLAALQRRPQLTAGLDLLELIAAVRLDLALHDAAPGQVPSLQMAERRIRRELDLPALLSPRHHGGDLASLFANQRSGGDFRSLWSAVLAADAFAAFRDQGILDTELADQLRAEILSRGNERAPMASWRAFRQRPSELRFLLEETGLAPATND